MTTYSVTARLADGSEVDLQPYKGEGFDSPDDNRTLSVLAEFGPVRGFYVEQLKALGYSAHAAASAEIKATAID